MTARHRDTTVPLDCSRLPQSPTGGRHRLGRLDTDGELILSLREALDRSLAASHMRDVMGEVRGSDYCGQCGKVTPWHAQDCTADGGSGVVHPREVPGPDTCGTTCACPGSCQWAWMLDDERGR